MDKEQYWQNVRFAADKLGVPYPTYRSWKYQGRVGRNHIIPTYKALKGTKHIISLEDLIAGY